MNRIFAFFGVAILAMAAIVGLQATLEDAGEDRVITNETWTPDPGSVTTLEESNREGAYYGERVTVYDENSTEMDSETDYEWYVGNGTVKAISGGELDGDSSATITYRWQQTTEEQRQMAAMLGRIPQMAGMAVPIGAVVALLVFARGG